MSELSLRDRELVAIGAAIAANCVPCVEFHVPKAREAGLSDDALAEVFELADRVRQVPAAKVLQAATAAIGRSEGGTENPTDGCAEKWSTMSKDSSCC